MEELAEASYENSDHIIEMVEKIVMTFRPVGNKPTGNEFVVVGQRVSMMAETAAARTDG